MRLAVSWSVVLLMLAGLVPASGCGPGSDRLAVSGDVTLDGAPLDRGSIRFSSMGDGPLVASGALIRDGKFQVAPTKGLSPGKYRVQITSPDLDAKPVMMPARNGQPGYPVQPDRIPEEYNVHSNQTVEVVDGGDNHFTFDITTHSSH